MHLLIQVVAKYIDMKKKYLKYGILLLIILSCQRENSNEGVIESFVNQFFVNEHYDVKDVNAYMSERYIDVYRNLDKTKQKIHNDYMVFFIEEVRKKLNKNGSKFKLLSIEDAKEVASFKIDVNYEGEGEVYFLLDKNNNFLSLFVAKNNKIVSFCVDIYNQEEQGMTPYYFFNEYGKIE